MEHTTNVQQLMDHILSIHSERENSMSWQVGFPFVGNLPPLWSEIFVPQLTMNVLNTLWGPYIFQKLRCQKDVIFPDLQKLPKLFRRKTIISHLKSPKLQPHDELRVRIFALLNSFWSLHRFYITLL